MKSFVFIDRGDGDIRLWKGRFEEIVTELTKYGEEAFIAKRTISLGKLFSRMVKLEPIEEQHIHADKAVAEKFEPVDPRRPEVCFVLGCQAPVFNKKQNLCRYHYMNYVREKRRFKRST